jgi:alkanesulfonate monooxygenase SsuD/methylene tetrahydromethanopterin reductase-like flavin-dependent oxidoreductase (luciferase family)
VSHAEVDIEFGLLYDFRNPAHEPWAKFYDERLEQIAWAEKDLGLDAVWLSEHHFVDDGYCPSLFTVAAAIAQRTERMTIGTNLVVLPLRHPLTVAEDALTVDILSNGRFRLGVGNGYNGSDFDAFGTTLRHRKSRLEESISILRRAFSGDTFSHQGKHWAFPELHVTPPPIRPGGPEIWIGAIADPAIDRAARIADGFLSVGVNDVPRDQLGVLGDGDT